MVTLKVIYHSKQVINSVCKDYVDAITLFNSIKTVAGIAQVSLHDIDGRRICFHRNKAE